MPERRKVLYIGTKSNWGGAQRYVYDLAMNLPRDRFEAVVAAGGDGMLFDMLNSAGIRTIPIPGMSRDIHIYSELSALRQLVSIIRKEQPDAVHLNSSKAGGLGAVAARIASWGTGNRPLIVFTVHGWGFHEDRSALWRAAIYVVSWISSLFQDKIILLDTTDLAAAEKFIPRRKLTLIPNGIGDIDFYARADARAFLTKKIAHPISNDTFLIGCIAELTKNKGLYYLIDAAVRIKTEYPDLTFQLIIIGDGEEKENLKQQIMQNKLDDTIFLAGFIPAASRYLKALDIFMLPSLKEGLPYVLMEAMQAELPIIATEVGGIPDLIEDKKEGLLVRAKDTRGMTDALVSMIQHPEMRGAYAAAAAQKQETNFIIHAMIEHTITLYAPPQ